MVERQVGFWDVEERLKKLLEQGDPLAKLAATVDFELFRPGLQAALRPRDRAKGGRPGFDPVLKFKMLVLQAMHGLSLAQTEDLVTDRVSWMRFCAMGPGDAVPDANTRWDFREALIAADAIEALFRHLDFAASTSPPRSGDYAGRQSAHVRPDRRRHLGGRAPPAPDERGEGGHREGPLGRRDLAGRAGQGVPEGHRCALDDEEVSKAKPAATGRRRSTSPCRASATNRTSRSIAATGSSGGRR